MKSLQNNSPPTNNQHRPRRPHHPPILNIPLILPKHLPTIRLLPQRKPLQLDQPPPQKREILQRKQRTCLLAVERLEEGFHLHGVGGLGAQLPEEGVLGVDAGAVVRPGGNLREKSGAGGGVDAEEEAVGKDDFAEVFRDGEVVVRVVGAEEGAVVVGVESAVGVSR